MTSKEIDAAMRQRCPVMYGGVRYRRVTEYVCRYDENGQRQLSAVLLDRNGNCTVRVPAGRVEGCCASDGREETGHER